MKSGESQNFRKTEVGPEFPGEGKETQPQKTHAMTLREFRTSLVWQLKKRCPGGKKMYALPEEKRGTDVGQRRCRLLVGEETSLHETLRGRKRSRYQ